MPKSISGNENQQITESQQITASKLKISKLLYYQMDCF